MVEALRCHHLPRPELVTPSTTQASSPSPQCCSRARHNNVLPEPVMLCSLHHSQAHDANDPRRPWAHNVIILPEPATSRARYAVKLAPSLSPQCCRPPQAHKGTLYIFLCHFGLQILILICYIATLL
jgi:hypothetical protein